MNPPEHDDRLHPSLESALDAQFVGASDDALLARVKSRVLAAITNSLPENLTVRSDEGWEPMAPGIERKLLWRTGETLACMLRCAPGATLPRHFHGVDEECIVLEGSMRIEPDIVLHAGDFHLGRQGSRHGAASTDTGCLVYLRGAVGAASA
jgi:quercetin dioxygenase-like cupin family protein